jgi:hypothetical protein
MVHIYTTALSQQDHSFYIAKVNNEGDGKGLVIPQLFLQHDAV